VLATMRSTSARSEEGGTLMIVRALLAVAQVPARNRAGNQDCAAGGAQKAWGAPSQHGSM
jgi:aspartate aminotransferase-like enzyme